ncbi:MAG: metallophosphoesterase [Candidatus Kapaibacterium sp.]
MKSFTPSTIRPLRSSLLLGCLLFGGCSGKLIPRQPLTAMETPYYWNDDLRPRTIIAIGDLQPTRWVEFKFLGRPQNDSVRSHMIDAVVENRPDMLLLLGDQVGDGEREEDWLRFDQLMMPVCREKIPIYAVVGNHDYGLLGVKGIRHFQARFPYSNVLPRLVWLADSVAMVVMDSNLGSLPKEEVDNQLNRYKKILKMLDNHPSVRGVIVTMHHPPFSNATLSIDSRVHDLFVPPFVEAKKTMLLITGHVHSYERFQIDGKAFVVSGGGGGPRRRVDTSQERSVKSDQITFGEFRPYHYVQMQIDPEGINCEMMMLDSGKFSRGDQFLLKFPH